MRGSVSKLADKRCSSSGQGGVLSLSDRIASKASMNVTVAAGDGAARCLLLILPPPFRFIMSTVLPLPEMASLPRRARNVTRVTCMEVLGIGGGGDGRAEGEFVVHDCCAG
jgi:hypothetical protein